MQTPSRLLLAAVLSTGSFTLWANPVLTVNGVNTDYSKSNFYIDEVRDSTFPSLSLVMTPNAANVVDVEVFTNLNNRDRATADTNSDGIEDGILPPDGSAITTADTDTYFQAYDMADQGNGTWTLTLPVNKTGAYRITGRYRVSGNPNWIWLGNFGIRDHAVVVAPKQARDMNVYELHVTNVNATAPTFAARGTFEDLHDPAARVNMSWLRDMGVNWIWFQPFHPQGIDGRQNDPATGSAYDPGSPYSIRNFWEINPLYTSAYNGALTNPVEHPDNYAAAMTAFQNFVVNADTSGVQLMLDFPFNHTAPDVVLGQKGVDIFGPQGNDWQPNDRFRDRVPGFFSTAGGNGAAYSAPAANSGDIAVAPDRNDFGKWNDVRDVFFGTYSTLVTGYPDASTSQNTVRNESDTMNYGSLGTDTINVWRYFGEVLPYWIVQSGHRGSNTYDTGWTEAESLEADLKGIDGLRKDFGQGLPPQCMEYIINRTHSVKWNFVFMSESLDGGEVTYRSSRHFAVLNENIVFPLASATTASGYRGVFEDRRNAYNQSLVLLNNTSHDELPYADPWEALIRFATVSTNDGAPMIMYGQEIGAARKSQETLPQGSWDWYELNFGKNIPHFKKWNSMQPQWTAWDNNDLGVQFLRPVYAGIAQAREFSDALRSTNRWFINRKADGNPKNEIFSVVKYTDGSTPLAFQDVVMAFTNLDRNNVQADTFEIPSTLADLMGLADGREYNVKNIAAYEGRNGEHVGRRDIWLWPSNVSRGDLLTNGAFVSMNPVPAADATWTTAPYEAQFLKVYDVTPPPAPATAPVTTNGNGWSGSGTLHLTVNTSNYGTHDNVTSYQVVIRNAADQVVYTGTWTGKDQISWQVDPGLYGQTVNVVVTPVSAAGIAAAAAAPESADILLLDPTQDEDGDGMTNGDEEEAGTDATLGSDVLEIETFTLSTDRRITIPTETNRRYRLLYSEDFLQGASTPTWVPAGSWQNAPASGPLELIDNEADPSDRVYAVEVEAL